MRILQRVSVALATAAVVASCGPPTGAPASLADRLAPLPARPPSCTDGEEADDRLVVDWPPLDRSKLESAVRRGVVLVRVSGCTARIADGCWVKRRYEYSPTSRQREVMTVRDRGELGARLPLGAVRFAASMEASSALDVAMTVVGRYESEPRPVSASDLEGSCEGVTHVVASVSVGSFAISAASGARLAGAADVLVGGAHARSEAERRHLDSAGIEGRCAEAKRTDTAPPDDCGIPLRLELRALGGPIVRPPPPKPPPDELRAVMTAARREVAPCYRQELARSESVAGTLTLAVAVGTEGNVLRITARHDVSDALASCATRRIERLAFPRATTDRPRVFVVPFVFARGGARDDR